MPLAITLVSVCGTVAIGLGTAAGADEPASIHTDRYALNGVSIGSSVEEVVKAFGDPIEIEDWSKEDGYPHAEYRFDGATAYFIENEAQNIHCTSPRLQTPAYLRFHLRDGKVAAIELWFDFT